MVEAGRFEILAVCKDGLLSRVWQGRIVDENRQSGTRLPPSKGKEARGSAPGYA
jgi:hypothetical protein